eukprot:2885708-Amphidinium_carterae.1
MSLSQGDLASVIRHMHRVRDTAGQLWEEQASSWTTPTHGSKTSSTSGTEWTTVSFHSSQGLGWTRCYL